MARPKPTKRKQAAPTESPPKRRSPRLAKKNELEDYDRRRVSRSRSIARRAAVGSVRNAGDASRARDDESEEPIGAAHHMFEVARVTWPLSCICNLSESFSHRILVRTWRRFVACQPE